jgi:hypothetical protein
MLFLRRSIALLVIAAATLLAPAAAAYCPSRFRTDQFGDGQSYGCYLTGQDDDYCYYDCYLGA